MKKHFEIIFTLFGYSVSLILLFYVFKNFDYKNLINAIEQYGYWRPLLASIIYLSIFLVRGIRTQILSPVKMTYKVAVASNILNFGFNNILPLKGGDLYKIIYLKNKINLSRLAGFGILLIERFLDLFIILLLLLLAIFFIPIDSIVSFKIVLLLTSIITVGGTVGSYLVLFHKTLLLSFIKKMPYSEFFFEKIIKFLEPLNTISTAQKGFKIFLLTIIIWLAEAFVFYILLYYYNGNPFLAITWMSLLALSFLVPTAPGNIGIFEYISCLFLVNVVLINSNEAIMLAVLAHFSQIILVTLASFLILLFQKRKQV